jgi:hypothetical protein
MSDDAIRKLFAQQLALRAVIDALIATHPDPAKLAQAIRHYGEPVQVGLLNSPMPDIAQEKVEEELTAFVQLAERYAQSQK